MKRFFAFVLVLGLLLAGCSTEGQPELTVPQIPSAPEDLGGDNQSFGGDLESTGAYEGLFDGESADVSVQCLSGTQGACTLEGTTLKFSAIGQDSVYAVSGKLRGNIVIDVGEGHKLDLELHGFSLVSEGTNPVTVLSGDEIALKAKKDTQNYIYDLRPAVSDEQEYSGAVHSLVDLEIGGKGALTVVSENNQGIRSKKDLQVKNLTLLVACVDNALRGNDSVELTGGNTTLIASKGDGIKTANTDISQKGNQRGSVTVAGGIHTVYAACDGIDAAYDVEISDATTALSIYTDKYSGYSQEVTATPSSEYYFRFPSRDYSYSVKFINAQTGEIRWVDAKYHSEARGGRQSYYYYAFTKPEGFDKMQFFLYSEGMTMGQEEDYAAASDEMTVNTAYDTIAISGNGYSWTNYTTSVQPGGFGGGPGGHGGPGGPGGMQDGNTEKGDHSTKGIKAGNQILIHDGTVGIKAYDDAIHANGDTVLDNGQEPLGSVTIDGGSITLYSNDDGIHADGDCTIRGGVVHISHSYEALEGATVSVLGGAVSVIATDDGINATTNSGTAITVGGGKVYICCTGDGMDANSRTAYEGIVFSGGQTVVISNSGMNSAIDTEQGYRYEGGQVVALMPRGGMSGEATHCQNFSQVGVSTQMSLGEGAFLVAGIGDSTIAVKMPAAMNANVIVLGDSGATVTAADSVSGTPDESGVVWGES